MLNIDPIQNGIVIDHIQPGGSMRLVKLAGLEKSGCRLAIIQHVRSNKTSSGEKDMIKLEGDTSHLNLDVLGYLDEIPVCVGYEIDGQVTREFPTTSKLEKARPVLTRLPGWKCDIRGIKRYQDLPENCRKYIEFVEKEIEAPISMVSNGPGRDDIIMRR